MKKRLVKRGHSCEFGDRLSRDVIEDLLENGNAFFDLLDEEQFVRMPKGTPVLDYANIGVYDVKDGQAYCIDFFDFEKNDETHQPICAICFGLIEMLNKPNELIKDGKDPFVLSVTCPDIDIQLDATSLQLAVMDTINLPRIGEVIICDSNELEKLWDEYASESLITKGL